MAEQVKILPGDIRAPEPIRAAIVKAGGKFNPAGARAEFTANKATWQLYLDLLELDQTKLESLLERHGDAISEPDAKFNARKRLAAVFNLVPTIVGMFPGYLFAEEPQINVKDDPDLERFIQNADGRGMTLVDWLRRKALPLAIALGYLDTLVQNPFVDGQPATADEATGAKLFPVVCLISPVHRTNWSASPNGDYNWVRFQDRGNETLDPFVTLPVEETAYVSLCAAIPGQPGFEKAFWFRAATGLTGAKQPVGATDPGSRQTVWNYVGDFFPTVRCPVATLYYRESLDPSKRHWGVSKLGTIAVLTRLIVQVLSWTAEDILSNLALLALPSKGGKRPTGEDGNPITPTLNPTSICWFDAEAGGQPMVIQGAADHSRFKMEFITALITEILRQANLLGVSGDTESVTSGVQGWVMRSELFQELKEIAGALELFTWDLLALAKSMATNSDVSREDLKKQGVTVEFHKGPFTTEPLMDVILNAQEIIKLYRGTSPEMVKAVLEYTARTYLMASDKRLDTVIKEIQAKTPANLETIGADPADLMAATQAENARREAARQADKDRAARPAPAAAGTGGNGARG